MTAAEPLRQAANRMRDFPGQSAPALALADWLEDVAIWDERDSVGGDFYMETLRHALTVAVLYLDEVS